MDDRTASNAQKENWAEAKVATNVSRAAGGDDTFSYPGGYYNFVYQAQQGWTKVIVTMMTARGDKSIMTLDSIYQSSGQGVPDTARVWTGKMNWPSFASNEACTVIVPEGFGAGKPALAIWQWTVDAGGKTKTPSIRSAVQQTNKDDPPGKFILSDYYNLACNWDQASERLQVQMEDNPGQWRDMGMFDLLAAFTPDKPAIQDGKPATQGDEPATQGDNDKDEIIEGLEMGLVAMKKDRDHQKKALEECRKQTGTVWQPTTRALYPFADTPPLPLQASIQKHQTKSSWAQMSQWIGNMSNRGNFFNSLDDIDETFRLAKFAIWSSGHWITGFKLEWTNGKTQSYGVVNGNPSLTFDQTGSAKVVAAAVLTDKVPNGYQPVNAVHLYGFDKNTGYGEVGSCAASHNPWTAPLFQTSFAPALQGSWSLRGVYGYYDGSLDALGFIWGKEE